MKRVETININGIVFSIDDDAFAKLNSYLDTLGKYFEKEQEGREIITDIEARISELFAEREGGAKQVVAMKDVTKVIETLGTPEDIAGADDDEQPDNKKQQRPTQPKKSLKRLYRDTDHRYLGGVCAGLSAWLGINPTIIRLILVLIVLLPFPRFMFGIFGTYGFHGFHGFPGFIVLCYFILWLVLPKARTSAQKLEMRGEPVTISNIEKNIKETLSDPALKRSFRDFLEEFGEFWGRVFSVFGRIIAILLGLVLLCLGFGFAISMISFSFFQDIVFNHWVQWDFLSFTELFRHIVSSTSYTLLLICVILIAALFIFSLLFWGVQLIIGFNVKHKLLHVSLFILWILVFFMGIAVCISEVRNFAWRNEQIVDTVQITPSDTLYLALAPSKLQISNNPMEIYFDKDNRCFYGKPNLNVRKSDNGQFRMRINRESQGESKRAAYQYAEDIAYSVDIRDSLLTFPQYFTVIPQDKWKFQTLNINLYVPEGTVIITDKAFCRNFRWYSNAEYTWVMTEKRGLQRVEHKE